VATALLGPPALAQQEYPPSRVKAAFLYNFGSYVEWPPGRGPKGSFVIAVLGAEDIARDLREIVAGRMVQGNAVQVREIDSPAEIGDAHIVFVGEKRAAQVPRVVAAAGNSPLLVVSDAKNGLRMGATINFAIVERRVRFEISMPAAERAGLNLSSRLLAIALHVERSGRLRGDRGRQVAAVPFAAPLRGPLSPRARCSCDYAASASASGSVSYPRFGASQRCASSTDIPLRLA
jgi:hypothetical protein